PQSHPFTDGFFVLAWHMHVGTALVFLAGNPCHASTMPIRYRSVFHGLNDKGCTSRELLSQMETPSRLGRPGFCLSAFLFSFPNLFQQRF
ncbi:hypothetical protein, partial [Comamonas terrae]|uniref:hypothetical protein n=1 Tax=Comamonas terrae TaxID=673548 RepID=UPI001C3F3D6E